MAQPANGYLRFNDYVQCNPSSAELIKVKHGLVISKYAHFLRYSGRKEGPNNTLTADLVMVYFPLDLEKKGVSFELHKLVEWNGAVIRFMIDNSHAIGDQQWVNNNYSSDGPRVVVFPGAPDDMYIGHLLWPDENVYSDQKEDKAKDSFFFCALKNCHQLTLTAKGMYNK